MYLPHTSAVTELQVAGLIPNSFVSHSQKCHSMKVMILGAPVLSCRDTTMICKLFNARKPADPGLCPSSPEHGPHTQSCNWAGKEKWRWMSNNVKRFIRENTGNHISTGYGALIVCTAQCDSRQKPNTLLSLSGFHHCSTVAGQLSTARRLKRVPEGTGPAPTYSERDAGFVPVTWEMSSKTEFLEKLWLSTTAP